MVSEAFVQEVLCDMFSCNFFEGFAYLALVLMEICKDMRRRFLEHAEIRFPSHRNAPFPRVDHAVHISKVSDACHVLWVHKAAHCWVAAVEDKRLCRLNGRC